MGEETRADDPKASYPKASFLQQVVERPRFRHTVPDELPHYSWHRPGAALPEHGGAMLPPREEAAHPARGATDTAMRAISASDLDGDHAMDIAEFGAAILHDRAFREKVFQYLDPSSHGRLGGTLLKGVRGSAAQHAVLAAVAAADFDEDGAVSLDEFGSALERDQQFCKAVFRAVDRDDDGLLDREPFLALDGLGGADGEPDQRPFAARAGQAALERADAARSRDVRDNGDQECWLEKLEIRSLEARLELAKRNTQEMYEAWMKGVESLGEHSRQLYKQGHADAAKLQKYSGSSLAGSAAVDADTRAALAKENADLKRELAGVEAKRDALARDNAALKTELEGVSARAEQNAAAQLAAVEATRAALARENAALQRELEGVRAEENAAKRQLAEAMALAKKTADAESAAVKAMEENFVCPISHEIMSEPVVAADGFTYERWAIAAWLQNHDTSPKTGGLLESEALYDNFLLRRMILEFKEAHPDQHAEGGAGAA